MTGEPVDIRVLREDGTTWPIYLKGNEVRVQGEMGERYALQFLNNSETQTFTFVPSIDGLSASNGRPAKVNSGGYNTRSVGPIRLRAFRSMTTLWRPSDFLAWAALLPQCAGTERWTMLV